MQKNTDFSNMTLEELTPIVSMRPGKEYTREELRAARIAFMTALGMHNAESAVETDALTFEDAEKEDAAAVFEEETCAEAPLAEEYTEKEPVQEETVQVEEPALIEDTTEEGIADEPSSPTMEASIEVAPVLPKEPSEPEEPVAEVQEEGTTAEADEFILEHENRPARLLYILYAYLLVPILAIESLLFLVTSVAVAVCVPDIPFLALQVFCAMIYPVVITISWHQLLHRTEFGLLLNRSLIAIGIFRAISHLVPGNTLVLGIIELAVFSLFFIFFVGYDNTFIIPSPKKQRAR